LDDPVVFLEHIGLYGLRGGKTGWGDNINQIVDTTPDKGILGKAKIVRGGSDLTLVCWGSMLHVALKAAAEVAKQGIEVEIIDLRTIIPFDHETCIASVARTGKLLILQESQWNGGLGHSIQNRIIEEAFWALEAQPRIIGALDTPVPFSPPLEDYFIPDVSNVIEGISNICS
jgi:pyruvate/2-oxoglutarate/acetoin dehydrogenase E1 component